MSTWPLVDPRDDGIRPAGKPDQCFYCARMVGEEHKRNCVIVKKRVRLRHSFDIEVDMPHSWGKRSIEFARNESSWCADNALDDIKKYIKETGDGCACFIHSCELLEVVDDTPRRALMPEEEEPKP